MIIISAEGSKREKGQASAQRVLRVETKIVKCSQAGLLLPPHTLDYVRDEQVCLHASHTYL